MVFGQMLFGIAGLVSVLFMLFPNILQGVLEMDTARLVVHIVAFVCAIYWIVYGINQYRKHRGLSKNKVVHDAYGHQYLVDGDTINHIPDPETFNYLGSFLGFTWTDSELVGSDEIASRFKKGRQLPSVRLYFPKKEEQ